MRSVYSISLCIMAMLPGISLISSAQDRDAECRNALRSALQLRNALPDSGHALYRAMTITTVQVSLQPDPDQTGDRTYDTVSTEVETIEADNLQIVRSDSTEMWADNERMVVLDRPGRTLRTFNLRSHRKTVAGQRRLNAAFPDSLAEHAERLDCRRLEGGEAKHQEITFDVVPHMQPFYNARRISMTLREDGEIVRFSLLHPAGSPTISTEYRVDRIDREYVPPDSGGSVSDHFFRSDGTPKNEFSGFRVVSR